LRALVQRVSEGSVFIANEDYSANIEKGMVLLLGIKSGDTIDDVNYLADKCCNLRIFEDDDGKMNLSINDISGEILVISQFTLYGDTKRGNRPGFTDAAKPDEAIPLYEKFIRRLKENIGENKVKTGLFGAMMQVKIINEGPVTLMIETK
jgi:D-tyrosyl-tRNA(Tyr) deacylase